MVLPAKSACAQCMKEQRSKDQWIIEDPFDLGHNLAAQCTAAGKGRMVEAMEQVHEAMARVPEMERLQAFDECCPAMPSDRRRWMKCRIDPKKVPGEDFAAAFSAYPVAFIHFPQSGQSEGNREVFLEFLNETDRRRTHTLNETYIGAQQLRLFYVTRYAFDDAKVSGSTFNKMRGGITMGHGCITRPPSAEPPSPNEEVRLQRERVREGIRCAEGRDELDILARRASALELTEEATQARKRMQREIHNKATPNVPVPAKETAGSNTVVLQFQ